MQEQVYFSKYKLLEKVKENEYSNIVSLAWLMNKDINDARAVKQILSNQTILTTREVVEFVCRADRLFDFAASWVSLTEDMNTAALCKMHRIIKGEEDNTAGVIKFGTVKNWRDSPVLVCEGNRELKDKLSYIQQNTDKCRVAREMFRFIVEGGIFYDYNVVVAFMAADCILVRFGAGYFNFSNADKVDELSSMLRKIEDRQFFSDDRLRMDALLDECIVKSDILQTQVC